MKKVALIALSLTLFLFACKKDKDFRDRYVGEYEGKANYDYLNYSHTLPNNIANSKLQLSKHPDIDNALIVDWAEIKYPNGESLDYTKEYSDYPYNPIYTNVHKNIIYISDEGFLYLENSQSFHLHKNCAYVEPDSLFVVITLPFYEISGNVTPNNYFFRLKKK